MRRAALVGALLFACTESDLRPERSLSSIIGGQPSTPGEYPETGVLLSVYDFGGGQVFASPMCTGTLIAPDVVMMAAHCTIDLFGASPKNYFSFELDVSQFGMATVDPPPDAIEFVALVPHPMFDFNTMPPPGLQNFWDVGLGFLTAPFVGPVPGVVADVQDGALLSAGASVAIVGYGQTSANGAEYGVKHQAISFINEIAQWEMQIGDVPPADPQKCHGDSGGPTFIDIDDGREPLRRVIGITSRAYDESDCNKGGIDMRADAFRSWFDQEMRDRCTSGERPASSCAAGGGLPLPGGVIPPPIDAGFPDTGAPEDTGVEIHPDASFPPDASEIEKDAGMMTAMDSGVLNIVGGRRPRDPDCACSAAEQRGSPWLLVLLLATALWRARAGRSPTRDR